MPENMFLPWRTYHKEVVDQIVFQSCLGVALQCSPANPAEAGEEAVGLADLSGLPSSSCVLVGE